MRILYSKDCSEICCRISKGLLAFILAFLMIMITSYETSATLTSQEDRYRSIGDSDNSGGRTGGTNSGNTSGNGSSGGTSISNNSVSTDNSNSGKKPKSNNKIKTITLKNNEFTIEKAKVVSYSKRVKTGTMRVNLPWHPEYSYGGYLKFTAPKKGRYSFTITNVKKKTNGDSIGYCYFLMDNKKKPGELKMVKVSTQGGRKETLWYSERGFFVYRNGKAIVEALKSRTGKINLQAGQTVYLYFGLRKAAFTLIIR